MHVFIMIVLIGFFVLKDIYDERFIHAWDNFEGFSLFRKISRLAKSDSVSF